MSEPESVDDRLISKIREQFAPREEAKPHPLVHPAPSQRPNTPQSYGHQVVASVERLLAAADTKHRHP